MVRAPTLLNNSLNGHRSINIQVKLLMDFLIDIFSDWCWPQNAVLILRGVSVLEREAECTDDAMPDHRLAPYAATIGATNKRRKHHEILDLW